jgi:hypothetical protein
MINELRQKAVVQAGGVVSIQSSELSAGTAVEVVILIETEKTSATEQNLTQLIGTAKDNFANPEAVDRFIRQERDTWDS